MANDVRVFSALTLAFVRFMKAAGNFNTRSDDFSRLQQLLISSNKLVLPFSWFLLTEQLVDQALRLWRQSITDFIFVTKTETKSGMSVLGYVVCTSISEV